LFTQFPTTKTGFLGVYEFHQMRKDSRWLLRVSMLHERLDLNRERQQNQFDSRFFWLFFRVFGVYGIVCECYKGVNKMFFFCWNNLKIRFFRQNTSCLIFQTSLWWLNSGIANDTSYTLIGDMSPVCFISQKIVVNPFKIYFFKKNKLTPLLLDSSFQWLGHWAIGPQVWVPPFFKKNI